MIAIDYNELPSDDPCESKGDGWTLLTQPCKELENLFCDSTLLFEAYDKAISVADHQAIIDDVSSNEDLINQWRYQVPPRVRDRLPGSQDPSTRERVADETFDEWTRDPAIRQRLVAGRSLLRRIRHRIRQDFRRQFYPSRVLEKCENLSPPLERIARCVFPLMANEADSES